MYLWNGSSTPLSLLIYMHKMKYLSHNIPKTKVFYEGNFLVEKKEEKNDMEQIYRKKKKTYS